MVSFLQKVPQDVKSLLAFLMVTAGSLKEASNQLSSSPMSSRDFEDGSWTYDHDSQLHLSTVKSFLLFLCLFFFLLTMNFSWIHQITMLQ